MDIRRTVVPEIKVAPDSDKGEYILEMGSDLRRQVRADAVMEDVTMNELILSIFIPAYREWRASRNGRKAVARA
jgi:hypothetical protein